MNTNPHTQDGVEIDMADRARALEAENTRLREYIADLEAPRPPRPHWHLTAGMPGYLPHRGPEYIGDTALQAAHGLADELDRLSDDECACTDDAVEMCEIHFAEAAVRSAIADGDYVNGLAVVVDNTVYEVEEAPGDCTCYEEEGQ